MKQNKNGWGTLQMILLSGGLLLALIVAIFFISKLYGSLGSSINNKEYMDLETRLENAASMYIRQNNINVEDTFRVSLKTLQDSGLINDFKDSLGNNCDGYVLVINNSLTNSYEGKINCLHYTTLNY